MKNNKKKISKSDLIAAVIISLLLLLLGIAGIALMAFTISNSQAVDNYILYGNIFGEFIYNFGAIIFLSGSVMLMASIELLGRFWFLISPFTKLSEWFDYLGSL